MQDDQLAIRSDLLKDLTDRPLNALPPELRQPAFQTWLSFRFLTGFETPASLCFTVAVWIGQHDVSPVAVAKALKAVTHPRYAAKIKFASDLMAQLADLIERNNPDRRVSLSGVRVNDRMD